MPDNEAQVILTAVDRMSGTVRQGVSSMDELTAAMARLIEKDRAALVMEKATEAVKNLAPAEKIAALEAYNLKVAQEETAAATEKETAAVKKQAEAEEKARKANEDHRTALQKVSAAAGTAMREYQGFQSILGDVSRAVDQTVGNYMRQADAIRTLSQATGTGTAETSRLVEVFDDAGVDAGRLRAAMIGMKNAGLDPTIESVAMLADKYRALTDPTEKVTFLTKNFGTRGTELGKIFDQTGDEIRAAGAAVNESLIFDEKKLAETEKLRKAQDEFNDTIRALKNQVVGELIPGWNALIGGTKLLADAMGKVNDAAREQIRINTAQKEAGISVAIATRTEEEAAIALAQAHHIAYPEALKQVQARKALVTEEGEYRRAAEWSTKAIGNQLSAQAKALSGVKGLTGATAEAAQQYATYSQKAYYAAQVTDSVTLAQEKAKTGMQDLQAIMAGEMGKEMDNFNQKQTDTGTKMDEVRGKIELLSGQKYLSADQKTELADLKTQLQDLGQQYNEEAMAHEERTKRIIYDLTAQKLAQSDLSGAEQLEILSNLATKFGLVDTATQDATAAIKAITDQAALTGNWDNYQKAIASVEQAMLDGKLSADELKTALDLLDGKQIQIGVNITTTGSLPPVNYGNEGPAAGPNDQAGGTAGGGGDQGGGMFASGADFVVPPGYVNDSYRMRVSSGEHVTVTPAGSRAPGGDVVTYNIYNPLAGRMALDERRRRKADRANALMGT